MSVELSEILASYSRQNILRALYHKHEIGLTKLVEDVNSTYNEVMRNVRILEGEGIVTLIRCGHRCYISLNYENSKTKILIEALYLLDSKPDFTRQQGALVV
jgi:DNA-binding transcriptional ArsR family regulator